VRAIYTRYEVPGWGVGELWTSEVAVLDHELVFAPGPTSGASLVAAPHEGAASPPTGTVAPVSSQMASGSVSDLHRAAGPAVAETAGAAGAAVAAQAEARTRTGALDADVLVTRFTAFLDGSPDSFEDVPLDLDWCTPFQRAVAVSLRAVPRGEVVSYAELAALAGYPGAQRAVGTFCARNRLALLIPCHRVVAADGIGGYGSAGPGVKRRLLALEGVVL